MTLGDGGPYVRTLFGGCDTGYVQYWGACSCTHACYPNDYGCASGADCCTGICNNYVCSSSPSPILINLKNDGVNYDLTSWADGVAFDIDADGHLDQVAWTEPDADVAFLVLDRNRNGVIDDGSELFGTATPKSNGERAANGFDALVDLDGGPSRSDGRIDRRDAVFSELRLWFDRNHNGFSEADELVTLTDAGIVAIFTAYVQSPRVDRYGNEYKLVGTALIQKQRKESTRRVFDVWLTISSALGSASRQ